jgi:ParB-like chromosome segregation protein Spo0J
LAITINKFDKVVAISRYYDFGRCRFVLREGKPVHTARQEILEETAFSDPETVAEKQGDSLLVETVPIDSLTLGYSPRLNGENMDHILLLAEYPSNLPPIVVHRNSMCVIDGVHRLRAVMLSGRKTIEVRFFDGNERDAFVFAVQANITHGLPLSQLDRKAAAERIVASHPEWSDRAISLTVGLAAKTVAEIRSVMAETPQVKNRIGLDGRTRPVNGAEGRRLACELMRKYPDTSLREIAREAGISPATAANVRDRMRRGDDPVPAGLRSSAKTDGHPKDRAPYIYGVREIDQKSFCDLAETIDSLRRDPSLRFNEAGRRLLRTFDACIAVGREKPQFIANTPLLRISSIVELARACAWILRVFADELQDKNVDSQDPGKIIM